MQFQVSPNQVVILIFSTQYSQHHFQVFKVEVSQYQLTIYGYLQEVPLEAMEERANKGERRPPERLVRLYGPDAYLNLPHLQPRSTSTTITSSGKFKWFPSKNFISMFPSCGLLNVNAQPSVHLIHQRLQELKRNSVVSQSPPNSSNEPKEETQTVGSKKDGENPPKDDQMLSEEVLGDLQEKPQIDLHEFLQQMGILKEERESERTDSSGSSSTMPEALLRDDNDHHLGVFSDNSVNWEALIDMHGIAGIQESEVTQLEAYDPNDDLTFSTSIWNF
ncbi:hypothetical protein JHK86_007435 [Glycine max]|nr:hypothetical protein JHK86_007435 [Glycine max]